VLSRLAALLAPAPSLVTEKLEALQMIVCDDVWLTPMNPEFCIRIQGLQNQLGSETGRGFTSFTENSRKPEKPVDFLFKTQIPNFIDGNWLTGRFDRFAGWFFILNSNTNIWWMKTGKPQFHWLAGRFFIYLFFKKSQILTIF
jgi:hypothetical protein